MINTEQEVMWAEFKPLWRDFQNVGENILLAGGYSLFLRQKRLLDMRDSSTVIPIERWKIDTATPRVTKDFDFIIGLDIMAEEDAVIELRQALERRNYVSKYDFWQFSKQLESGQVVIVDLMALEPPAGTTGVKYDDVRVKTEKSVKGKGIHGRTNPEAIGYDLHPKTIDIEDITIKVPNPVTMCVMKLISMRDRYVLTQDANTNEEKRDESRKLSLKHAQDTFKIVAMMTPEDRDSATIVVETLRNETKFSETKEILNEFFPVDSTDLLNISSFWEVEDFQILVIILRRWFSD